MVYFLVAAMIELQKPKVLTCFSFRFLPLFIVFLVSSRPHMVDGLARKLSLALYLKDVKRIRGR